MNKRGVSLWGFVGTVVLTTLMAASAAPDKWVVNDYPAHYETTNLRASFE